MAAIRWDSGAGEQTLTAQFSQHRFNGWRPSPNTIGERAHGVGDGVGYVFEIRKDYTAEFELSNIDQADDALVNDFMDWANAFGVFAIDTGDSESNTYAELQIAPGTLVDRSPPDPVTLDLTLRLTVLNISGTPVPLRQVW